MQRLSQSPQLQKSPSRAQSPRRAYPENIPSDILTKLSKSALGFSKEHYNKTKLDNELIKDYLQVMSKVSRINKDFNASLLFAAPQSWENVSIINLQNLKINQAILRVLNMTIGDQITTIVLRGISFDTDKTRDEFLKFFSKNTNVIYLILDDIKIDEEGFIKMLKISGTFTKLIWLEISNCVLSDDNAVRELFTILKLKSLNYFTFSNNTVVSTLYTKLFPNNVDNVKIKVDINEEKYRVFFTNMYDKNWTMSIQYHNTKEFINSFQINMVGNNYDKKYLFVDRKTTFQEPII